MQPLWRKPSHKGGLLQNYRLPGVVGGAPTTESSHQGSDISDMSTDEPTHKIKARDGKNGDTDKQTKEKEGDDPEEREGGGEQMGTFHKGTFYNPLNLNLNKTLQPKQPQPKTQPA